MTLTLTVTSTLITTAQSVRGASCLAVVLLPALFEQMTCHDSRQRIRRRIYVFRRCL